MITQFTAEVLRATGYYYYYDENVIFKVYSFHTKSFVFSLFSPLGALSIQGRVQTVSLQT